MQVPSVCVCVCRLELRKPVRAARVVCKGSTIAINPMGVGILSKACGAKVRTCKVVDCIAPEILAHFIFLNFFCFIMSFKHNICRHLGYLWSAGIQFVSLIACVSCLTLSECHRLCL